MAGVTLLALGNGSPDVFSTFAAMNTNSGSMAVGELIGAAGFITAVVAGSMALVREFKVGKKSFIRDVGFFIVAAGFSMGFLADGRLQLWECCVMIAFYAFYVVTVVTWHWYLEQRRRRRERDALSRGQYRGLSYDEVEVQEEDNEDEDGSTVGRRAGTSTEDFAALEQGYDGTEYSPNKNFLDDDVEENDHIRLVGTEMRNNMRVLRPRGSRRNTMNRIRPSLVGALEFRSVLSSLQKARGTNAHHIHLRRYSEDQRGSSNMAYEQLPLSAVPSEYGGSVVITNADDSNEVLTNGAAASRTRAVSMNDASATNFVDPAAFSVAQIPDVGVVAATPTFPRYYDNPEHEPNSNSILPSANAGLQLPSSDIPPSSPTISISTAPSIRTPLRGRSPTPQGGHQSYEHRLAPPSSGFPGAHHFRAETFQSLHGHPTDSPNDSPKTKSPKRPQLLIPSRDSSRGRSSSPGSVFPLYFDSPRAMSSPSSRAPSIRLPDTAVSTESFYVEECMENHSPQPITWWPYRILPDPQVLISVLFPTLVGWRTKTIWDKSLGILSAPSIFLLAITLPVVENESKDDDAEIELDHELERELRVRSRRGTATTNPLDPSSADNSMETEWLQYRRETLHRNPSTTRPILDRGLTGHGSTASVAVDTEERHHNPGSSPLPSKRAGTATDSEDLLGSKSPPDWNRWLLGIQIFTAPLFVVLITWANIYHGDLDFMVLFRLVLYSLLGSLITFAILVLTTSSNKIPKYRYLFCFVGFVVSISWISTIANEVVGVLKAFGVIVGISDAILGLTIFAVGNSLGDLVADITVARLGYPVMALSACFGGPMLNILLGIGISGAYITISEANHKHVKHPGKPIKYKPYEIDISGTLMISAATLLITLVGLLIAVPSNKWMMTRKIGWGLISIWTASTIINVVVECTGVWGDEKL
jgi:sodium/potassium/calcium exchanger 6